MKGRRIRLILALSLGAALLLPSGTALAGTRAAYSVAQRNTLRQYAEDTWRSFVAMTYPNGLTADNIDADSRVRARYTSPTNIASYIWSTLAARDLQIINPQEARDRLSATLAAVARLERHEPSGQFYNWYSPETGEKLTVWPVDQSRVYPFLSSVDNGWLAAALIMITNSVPQLREQAQAIVSGMDFGFYYDPTAGLIRGGYWPEVPIGGVATRVVGPTQCETRRAADPPTRPQPDPPFAGWTCHHYGAFNTEPRIASYIGIAMGQIPATHYFKGWRTFPETCDWGWHEMKPEGVTRTYLGVYVYEGHYTYRGMNIVPSWGGSMFEALMVPLLVPEEEWGTRSWAINHPLYVRAQIEHGLQEAGYGYWGFSPSNNPAGGYREYGVDAIGMEPNGYASDQERTHVDYGFGECRPPGETSPEYGQGVVTPHASFLALEFAPDAALENLSNLRRDFDAYGWGGFYDAINVGDPQTGAGRGQVSRFYLALDQGMILAAIGNALRNDRLQHYFVHGEVQAALRPLMAMEEFTAGP